MKPHAESLRGPIKFSLWPGDRIADKYRILSTLGSGGMGVVYLAHHERLDRRVAIKLLHAQLEKNGAAIKRFEREIKAVSLVNNRHIVHALDADVRDDGSLYLVMEYLEGRNLRAELSLRRAIPFPEAVAYVIQACEGIAAVHDLGITHRDLKPHNLFLTELTRARCIKILDFGIAKFTNYDGGVTTQSDVALGTPRYMSPEQLTTPHDVTPLSDIWALGVVLYELIAGLSPFAAATPGAVVAAVVLDEPVSLSKLVPEVPEELARIVAGALTKSRSARIADARELARQLAPFSMQTDAIFVPESLSAAPPAVVLVRKSMRPELSAQIEREVEAFDENGGVADSNTPPDARRELPSVGKLLIRQNSDHMPTGRPMAPSLAPPVRPPTPIQPPTPIEPPRPEQRWGIRTAGALVLLFGLLLAALAARARTRDTAEIPSPPALRSASAMAVSAAQPRSSAMLGAPQLLEPASEQPATPAADRPPSAASTARSALRGPARQQPVPASSPPPTTERALPVAADGKPLHL